MFRLGFRIDGFRWITGAWESWRWMGAAMGLVEHFFWVDIKHCPQLGKVSEQEVSKILCLYWILQSLGHVVVLVELLMFTF